MLRIDPSVYAEAINPAWPTGRCNHFRGRTGKSLRRGGACAENGARGCSGNAGPPGRHRTLAHGKDRTWRTHAHVGDHPQDCTGAGVQFGRLDDGDGKPACGCRVVILSSENTLPWRVGDQGNDQSPLLRARTGCACRLYLRSGATCSVASPGRQTECGGDGLNSRSPGGQTHQPAVGRDRWKSERDETHLRLDATHDSAAPRCRETQRQFRQECRNIKCKVFGTYPLMSAGSSCQRWRTLTAIERSRSERSRRALRRNGWARGGLGRPLFCSFIVEGACAPPR